VPSTLETAFGSGDTVEVYTAQKISNALQWRLQYGPLYSRPEWLKAFCK
jgi:hypothetical protein